MEFKSTFAQDLKRGIGYYGSCWLISFGLMNSASSFSSIVTSITIIVGFLGGLGAFYLTCALYRIIGDPFGGGNPTSLPLSHRITLVCICILLIIPYLWYIMTSIKNS